MSTKRAIDLKIDDEILAPDGQVWRVTDVYVWPGTLIVIDAYNPLTRDRLTLNKPWDVERFDLYEIVPWTPPAPFFEEGNSVTAQELAEADPGRRGAYARRPEEHARPDR